MVKVLVVDDAKPIREALRELLEEEGYAVEEARDGYEALAALERAEGPYVVLLDLVMPRLSGEAVLRAIAARPDWEGRHAVLLLTGRHEAARGELAALLQATGAGVLEKPFDLQVLCEAVLRAHVGLAARRSLGVQPRFGLSPG